MSSNPIVAGTDGSPRAELAVDRAGELARALGAPVHVACVPGALLGAQWPARVSAQEIVAAAADRLRGQGVDVETHLPKDEGDPAVALVGLAESQNAQMVVVGNKGMTGIRRLLGSFPNRVSHQARCGVLIIPTESPSLPEFSGRSIVVGTDGDGTTHVVTEGIRLAKALDGELHIVSISDSAEPPESAVTAAADQGVTAVAHPRQSDPAAALIELGDAHDAAIIVIGSKGMHADERDRFGNIADKLSHQGSRSVLIVSANGAGD